MFGEIFTLLINVTFYFLILVTFLRFLFQLLRVDFYNPVSQFVIKVTDPILGPLRNIIPIKGKFDWASVLLIIVLKLTETSLLELVKYGAIDSLYHTFAMSVMGLAKMFMNFYLFSIFAQIILSWLAPYNNNPAVGILYQITEPLMKPARKIIPPIGGLDLSPILVLFGIQVIDILLLHPSGLLPQLFAILGRSLGVL